MPRLSRRLGINFHLFSILGFLNQCDRIDLDHPEKECVCGPGIVQRYLSRISGPLLDRIDLDVEVVPVSFDKMTANRNTESIAEIQERVVRAREIQSDRFRNEESIHCNAMMPSNMVKEICYFDDAGRGLLKTAMERIGPSARAYDRILKVSRTVADLCGSEQIKAEHLAEAIHYVQKKILPGLTRQNLSKV